MFIASVHSSRNQGDSKCSSAGEWINKLWYMHSTNHWKPVIYNKDESERYVMLSEKQIQEAVW